MSIQGGEVAARPGGDPPAERGELKRLRIVAQCQPVLAQLILEDRSPGTGLDAGRERQGIDLQHPVKRREIDRDHARVSLRVHTRLDPAHHARPAAEGDDRGSCLQRPCQQRADVGLVLRPGDHVGRGLKASLECAHDIAVGPSVGVPRPLTGVFGA